MKSSYAIAGMKKLGSLALQFAVGAAFIAITVGAMACMGLLVMGIGWLIANCLEVIFIIGFICFCTALGNVLIKDYKRCKEREKPIVTDEEVLE